MGSGTADLERHIGKGEGASIALIPQAARKSCVLSPNTSFSETSLYRAPQNVCGRE